MNEPNSATSTEVSSALPITNSRWFLCWFKWSAVASSLTMLRLAEKKIFSFLKTAHRGFYVDIGPAVGEADKIWTISMNTESKRTPLVLIHGMGAGVGFWVLNLDALARHRPVYAIDILGFGRSSRPLFSADPHEAERQLVKSIEEWRREMNIPQMILLGHSLGGFLSTSYTMQHPDRVKHLILADPWGFQEKPTETKAPLWVRAIARALTPMNPLWLMRAAGPYGQWVVEKTRPDLIRKFGEHLDFGADEPNVFAQYIHQCNAQTPSGESAFHTMMVGLGWAKHPMLLRMDQLRADKPLTLLYGSRSWIDQNNWNLLKQSRTSVHVQAINGAGHHIFMDKPDVFNEYVNAACFESDGMEAAVAAAAAAAAEFGAAMSANGLGISSNNNISNDASPSDNDTTARHTSSVDKSKRSLDSDSPNAQRTGTSDPNGKATEKPSSETATSKANSNNNASNVIGSS